MDTSGRILLVIDGDSSELVVYSRLVGSGRDLSKGVEAASAELGLDLDGDTVTGICHSLKHNRAKWVAEKWCFDVMYF